MKKEQKPQIKSVKQDQIHTLLFNREIGWQEIIYDLINSEQLDPWDINITVLTDKYLAKIQELEEADFFVSSKVLLAAALLLRIKAEFLLKKHIKSIDEILFADKSGNEVKLEKNILNIDFEEPVPELIPKSPVPRFKKVTLQELIESLSKAIKTENRRINKEIIKSRSIYENLFFLPKKRISIKDKIHEIYEKLLKIFKQDGEKKKISFTEFSSFMLDQEEKVTTFTGLLHLDHQKKVWLEQEKPFEDFNIWLSENYLKHNPDPFADLREQIA